MTRTQLRSAMVLALLLALPAGGSALAAGPSADDLSAVESFRLTDGFIRKWETFQAQAAEKPCELSPMLALQKAQKKPMSLDETAAAFDAQPGVHAMLEKDGLTARQALLGMATLMNAAAQDIAAQHPDLVKKGEIQPNQGFEVGKANMAVYRAHKDELHRQQMKLAREQMQRNGGKLPACFGQEQ